METNTKLTNKMKFLSVLFIMRTKMCSRVPYKNHYVLAKYLRIIQKRDLQRMK